MRVQWSGPIVAFIAAFVCVFNSLFTLSSLSLFLSFDWRFTLFTYLHQVVWLGSPMVSSHRQQSAILLLEQAHLGLGDLIRYRQQLRGASPAAAVDHYRV